MTVNFSLGGTAAESCAFAVAPNTDRNIPTTKMLLIAACKLVFPGEK